MGKASNDGGSDKNLIRIFIAIDMPKQVKDEIKKIQDVLKKQDLFEGKYVNPDDAHLTLQFIGYIESVALAPIKKMLSSIEFEPLKARVGNVGFFGTNGFVKVIWLGILGDDIIDLAHRIEKGLSIGTTNIHRPFQAHVTVARVKKSSNVDSLKDVVKNIQVESVSFNVEEFILKQSVLTSSGHVYVDLQKYPE